MRRQLAELRRENERLKKLLRMTEHEATPAKSTQTAWFDRTPGPVTAGSSPEAKVAFYSALFGARRDVYSIRWENERVGKSGWMPAVEGGWSKSKKDNPRYLPLTPDVVAAHLRGSLHIGLYPMLPGDETCWLAADFDGAAAMLDALAYLKAARALGAPAALEVSRSGVGAHVWIFFTGPVAAATARQLGTGLIREAIALRGRMDLSCYDRLFPSQDTVPIGRFGNLIAAPLHGISRREHGTTVFLELATLEPYDDQWEYLSTLDRLKPKQVTAIAGRLREPTVGVKVQRLHTTAATKTQPRASARVHLTLNGGVHLPSEELTPAQYSTLKHAASMSNPDFYDRQRRRQSTWNIPRFIQSFDETLDGQLVLPRGLLDTVARVIDEAGSKVEVDDQRSIGSRIDATLTVELTSAQRVAVENALPHDLGVLVAPPGSGKTVMACAAIAAHSVSTLVLVDRKTLADQWRSQIQSLLGVKPGQLGGGRSKLSGIVDIATFQTLARRDDLDDKLAGYGLVVVDECHHIPAAAFEAAVRTIPARRWLGLTATPYRRDQLNDLISFQLGPVRYEFGPAGSGTLESSAANRPEPVLVVHPTDFACESPIDFSVPGAIAGVHRALAEDESRNTQIILDVCEALARDRNCLVLAQRTGHVDHLAELLKAAGHDAVVLRGGMGAKARAAAMKRLQPREDGQPLLAVATGSFVGEGFDCPALDTLFLAGPVSFKGRLVQYAGRVLRAHPGKVTAEVHDYHDTNVPVLAAALAKRAPGYVSLGFPDPRRQ